MNTQPIPSDPSDFAECGCCYVPNILSEDCRKLLLTMLSLDENNIDSTSHQVNGSYELYNTDCLNIINQVLLDKMKNITQINTLYSTYAFYRKYLRGQNLEKHSDRPECQISVTICLGESDDKEEWPIYLENRQQNIIYKGTTRPGDGVIYKGCELPHWRDGCNKKWTRQIFSHYSPNIALEFDKSNNGSEIMKSYLIKTILEND